MKTVCVVGLGYIGLPTAAVLAKSGYFVSGYDIDKNVVESINSKIAPIEELELQDYIEATVSSGNLRCYNTIKSSDIYLICVPTPVNLETERPVPDVSMVTDAMKKIGPHLKDGDLVVIESTCPVGTTHKLSKLTSEVANSKNVHFAYCPERVMPGKIFEELANNNRVVGGVQPNATKVAAHFYRSFVKGQVFETDAKTAEMTKLVENSYRDVNIAFANEISMICDTENIDAWELINLANQHPRVNILQPGPGVGGHCIAVDPWFLVSLNEKLSQLIKTAREVNDSKTNWVIKKIQAHIDSFTKEFGRSPKVALLGVTYKPDSDDLRESPALKIAKEINAICEKTVVIEPNSITPQSLKILPSLDIDNEVDILVTLVKHSKFQDKIFKAKIKAHTILDVCGLLS